MQDFEVYRRTAPRRTREATVSFARHGAIAFNRTAYELLGDPEAVVLLWKEDERIVGFRPAPKGEPAAYPVRLNGSNTSTRVISGSAFRRYIGLEGGTCRWPLVMQDGIGTVDLKQPGIPIGA